MVPNKPCAECNDCIPVGNGEGLCDFPYKAKDKFIVNLFEIEPNCPKMAWIEKKKTKEQSNGKKERQAK